MTDIVVEYGAATVVAVDSNSSVIVEIPAGSKGDKGDPAAAGSRDLDQWTGTPETADDSTTLQAAFSAAVAGGFTLRARAGKTYRGKNLDPTGTIVDWTGATLKHPDGGVAANMLAPTGAFRTIGGTFDGNYTATTDPGDDLLGNGVYCNNTAGWAGTVSMEGGPVFRNCWRYGARFQTVPDLGGTAPLVDAENAPAAAVFLDHPESYSNQHSGILAYGLYGFTTVAPYVHDNVKQGITIALCKAPRSTGVRAINNNIHGWVSQYCVDDFVDGVATDNGRGGFVWGGGSATIAPGRRHRFGHLVANRNGRVTIPFGGVTFDPTVQGDTNFRQIDAKGDSIIANDNSGAGLQLTFGIGLDVGSVTADSNDTNGIALSGAKFSYGVARCRNNGTTSSHHGIAEFGANSQYGNHFHGRYEISGNGDGLTVPFVAQPGVITASTFTMSQVGSSSAGVGFFAADSFLTTDHAGVAASTTVVDTGLSVALNSLSSVYRFRALIKYDGVTTGDIRVGISVPTGATASWATFGPTTTATGAPATTTTSGDLIATQVGLHGAVGVGSLLDVVVEGVVTLDSSHTGTLKIRYAQSTSDATATTVRTGSYLSVTRMT